MHVSGSIPTRRRTLAALLGALGLCCAPAPRAEEPPARIDQGLDWAMSCRAAPAKRPTTPASPRPVEALDLKADNLELDQAHGLLRLHGQVRAHQGDTYIEADQLIYHQAQRSADLLGDIYLRQPGLRLSGERGWLAFDSDRGWLTDVDYRLPEIWARGHAERVDMLSDRQSDYQRISYTTCPPGSNDWSLSASKLHIDRESGWGSARNAVLRLGALPVFYSPYLSFPVDERRKSGLLFPSFGSSRNLGSEFSIPYYLNLAPNYDATLTPRWMSRRGIMLGGELRYLGEHQQGVLSGEILHDRVAASGRGNRRDAIHLRHTSQPVTGLSTRIDASHVSDLDYLSDFGSGLAVTSTRNLEQTAEATYSRGDWLLGAKLQDFQTVDRDLSPSSFPYKLLPRLRARYLHPFASDNAELGLTSEYTYFRHDTNLNGQRLRLTPSLSLPQRRSWGHLIPRLSLNYATYKLDQPGGGESRPGYFVPTLSLDTGLVFERDSSWFGSPASQTLEPRLFALYTPFEDQSDIPDFDTALLDLTLSNLFRENRFSGGDRVGDARQVTLGLTSRWLARDSGVERLRASIGRIYYLQDRRVQLSGPPQEAPSSPFLAELSSQLGGYWRSSLSLRWDPNLDSEQIDQGRFDLHYQAPGQHLLNLGYNYRRDRIEDIDLSFYWRFDYRLSLLGKWQHSLFHGRDLNRIVGLEYGGRCCWKLRALYQRFVNESDLLQDINRAEDTRFMLQLELRGLSSLGEDVQQTLQEFIYGYQAEK